MIPSEPERQALLSQGIQRAADWLAIAEPGESRVYHEGWLMTDRTTDLEADGIAAVMLEASDQGLVELKQRKIAEGRYEYIVQKRKG